MNKTSKSEATDGARSDKSVEQMYDYKMRTSEIQSDLENKDG